MELAINGGSPVRTREFARWPVFDELEQQIVLRALQSGKWGGVGKTWTGEEPFIPQFEREFAQLQDAKYGVSCVNGTVALTAALQAAGVQYGDEVIIPPYTFVATATAVLAFGAIPVFADIESDTLLIDPDQVELSITPKTKAIIAVHIAGAPANLTQLLEISRKHGLVLIEDAAQAVGAKWEGVGVGAIGDLGTFSFQSSKNLNAGEGGIVITNNHSLWVNTWSICNVGRVPEGAWYQHEVLGQNYRMTDLQAAILLAQMTRLEAQMQQREASVLELDRLLGGIEGIRLLTRDPRITRHANHLYMFKLAPDLAKKIDKEQFIRSVVAEGIPVSYGYVPLNRTNTVLKATKQWLGEERVYECPVCEQLCAEEVLWLSHNVLLSEKQAMVDIAESLDKVIRYYGS
ncbi:DegT/DnrJ/EryC1/StrS family aminotransferase [Paenibacillus eucommiae]|uniref:dTDP-4-amino-4,6-dideoxygalactose transaminase n=1 Tax=Paenibacillus eucommiae TaxID=1355755 RepID=A0ABS4IUH6_9BACL|nr:DegT/DnrJ/EryC1/StrS family aminotransferase [Paenibacillus eucommiae]MBP1990224.1 dTDP-4-amino-4,6-dideoxygalactose transaminase [Paenibacillus eucommiae]